MHLDGVARDHLTEAGSEDAPRSSPTASMKSSAASHEERDGIGR